MRVFVTGANGWIGGAVVDELLGAGHGVLGLVRSDSSAEALAAKGATPLRGDLDDLASLTRGASEAEAVVHLANKHDWAHPEESNRAERAAVETLLAAVSGTDKPFALAAGVAGLSRERPALETDASPSVGPDSMRGGTENLALDAVADGIHAISLRFAPTVHGAGDHGFIAIIAAAAVRTGFSAYVGDGSGAWAAVHRADAARLVRLGVEGAPAGSKLHAVAEEGVPTRAIAEAIGAAFDLPVRSIPAEQAAEHFGGFVGGFFAMDLRASSDATRSLLGWEPTGPTLLEDIADGAYAHVADG